MPWWLWGIGLGLLMFVVAVFLLAMLTAGKREDEAMDRHYEELRRRD
jgi:hypothetical protein